MKFLKKLPVCVVLLLPLWLLSGCAVYDSVFHPHRLGTPPMTSSTKARIKAAEKARRKGTSLKAAEATSADGTTDPGAPPAADDAKSLSDKNKSIEDMLGNTYNTKTGLLKRSRLQRMQYNGHKLHHYDTRPLTPREASTENRKLRKKGHTDHGKDAPRNSDKKEKDQPLDPALDTGPDPGPPAAEPTNPPPKAKSTKAIAPKPEPTEPEPEPAPQPKKSKDKKTPVPRPDPTQSAPGE
ncbi:hypothetical protein QMK33_13770 [Hymenobacter sp. H14-R3]|uniref:hypothetical protein n=1 Tax=Hymenobacter sp. H14-R3 TaxID=3046308 RepID=UPI0024B896E0|nr:hypothetical protein [Hymenobacter sp. H14-R3]MDJ0366222.1 hypothetical protein [Hymenobacter sp. H14-R3]